MRRSDQRLVCSASIGILFVLLQGVAQGSVLIDSFEQYQFVEAPPGSSASDETSGAGILGGERDVVASADPGFGSTVVVVDEFGSDLLGFEQGWDKGAATITWDGNDSSILLDPTGLGGVDLTESGLADALALDVAFIDSDVMLILTVHTDAGNASRASVLLPGATPAGPFIFPFTSFLTLSGGGADFANVGAIALSISGSIGTDFRVDEFTTVQATPVPQPETFLLTAMGVIWIAGSRRKMAAA